MPDDRCPVCGAPLVPTCGHPNPPEDWIGTVWYACPVCGSPQGTGAEEADDAPTE